MHFEQWDIPRAISTSNSVKNNEALQNHKETQA